MKLHPFGRPSVSVAALTACLAMGACGERQTSGWEDAVLPTSGEDGGTGNRFSEGGTASCSDGTKNGLETDVDCGGSCSPCADGRHCTAPTDCTTNQCTGGTCCTTKEYDKTTGPVSSNTENCCAPGDELITYTDCGTGSAHSVMPAGNCAYTSQKSSNGGYACSKIKCRASTCTKSCQGKGYTKSTGPGGGQICCVAGDTLVNVIDCGDGDNHSVSTSGNCAVAGEGSGNHGSACALALCSTTPCPPVPDAGPPPPK